MQRTVSAVASAMYCAWLGSASARRPTYSTQLSLEGGAMNGATASATTCLRMIQMTTTADQGRAMR